MKAFVLTLAGFLLPTLGLLAEPGTTSKARVVDLRVERMTNPSALNHPLPRFGWRIETEEPGYLQTSYRILAASTPELLAQDKGDLWDSEEKPGRQSQFISFGGAPLTTGQTVHWKVKSKNRTGQFTPWSEPAQFTVKLSGPPELPSPLFLPVSEAPRLSSFECSDPKLNKIYELAAERLHEITSVRDIGLTMRAAAYHQEIHPRATAWLHHMNASIDAAGFYPAKLPSDGTYGSTQSDAAISATHALWWMTGDRAPVARYWPNMINYLRSREATVSAKGHYEFGSLPGSNIVTSAPAWKLVHQTSQGVNLRLMTEMARVGSQNPYDSKLISEIQTTLATRFGRNLAESSDLLNEASLPLNIHLLRSGLLTKPDRTEMVMAQVKSQIRDQNMNLNSMDCPFAAVNLLPILGWIGELDHAVTLASKQDIQSLSPVALAGISQWQVSMLAGLKCEEAGFQSLRFSPMIPANSGLRYVKASLAIPAGLASASWRRDGSSVTFEIAVPPNVIATVKLPAGSADVVTESGTPLEKNKQVFHIQKGASSVSMRCLHGIYSFRVSSTE